MYYSEKLKRAYTILPIYSGTRDSCKPAHFAKYYETREDFLKGASDWEKSLAHFDCPYNYHHYDELDILPTPLGASHVTTIKGAGVSACTVYRFWQDLETYYIHIEGVGQESYRFTESPCSDFFLYGEYKTSPGRYKEVEIICPKSKLEHIEFNVGFVFAPVWGNVKNLLKEEKSKNE